MSRKILVSVLIVLFIVSIIPVLAEEGTSTDLIATVLAPNKKPKADAGPNVQSYVDTLIEFSGAGSYDKDGEIASYSWSFGDGATATGPMVSHSYSESGHYTVTLTVTDDRGAEDSDKCQVKVRDHTWPVMNRFGELVRERAPVIPGEAVLGLYDVKVDVEDPQGVSGSRTDPGDVEYWALVIGISDYPGVQNDLAYCDDDAWDICFALVDYHGWDPGRIVLLLDSEANGDNVTYWLLAFSQIYVDSNDVFLFTFSGHGTFAEDGYYGDPIDELDGWEEYIVLHDAILGDDVLESYLGLFGTDKIMVFLDSCHSGGFIKSMSAFGEEVLTHRSLPSSEPVEIIDSFSRDLDNAGFMVLTACDDDETCIESSVLENGVFTYYFVQGITSGFPADTNTNGYISAEEAFYYASPLANTYNPWQTPQLYDGVPGELEFTAAPAHISINIDPGNIGFGTINKGESGTDTVTVMTTGNTVALITAELSGEVPETFYTTNLKLDSSLVKDWSIPSLAPNDPTLVELTLGIPIDTAAGSKTANLIFWAEIPP